MKTDWRYIYKTCLDAIGGMKNEDVAYIIRAREKGVTRDNFFPEAAWAIMVSGISRKGADTFSKRATAGGFSWDYATTAAWDKKRWDDFFTHLYPYGLTCRGGKKWEAIRQIAVKIDQFLDEAAFQTEFFAGKTNCADLNSEDVQRLAAMRLPFIGYTNAQYIIRNMGGEAVKFDRWISALVDYLGLTQAELITELASSSISLSLFDAAIWGYCERYVLRVTDLRTHFDRLLSQPTETMSDEGRLETSASDSTTGRQSLTHVPA